MISAGMCMGMGRETARRLYLSRTRSTDVGKVRAVVDFGVLDPYAKDGRS